MYEAFFGLATRPFADRPDPDFFAESELHAAALWALEDGLAAHRPILVITGETGCGKTMLARTLLQGLGAEITVGLITNPHTSVRDVTRWALLSFGQETLARTDSELREALALYFVSEYSAGRKCLLVVDEAQNLTPEALAGLHEYLDLNSEGECLLQLLLVGAPRLLQTLRDPSLAPWATRVPQICLVGPLARDEVPRYVRLRLAVAGTDRAVLTDGAMAAVRVASGGVPRLINAICEMALVYAFARGRDTVDREVITDVISAGRAAGFGSLAMLASVDGEGAAESDIAPFMESEIVADTGPDTLALEADTAPASVVLESTDVASTALPTDPAQDEVGQPEYAAQDPEPAAVVLLKAQAEEPESEPFQAPQVIVPTHVAAGWPSIARNSRLSRLGREGPIGTASSGTVTALRRRFLPRD